MPRKKIKSKKRRTATPDWKIEWLKYGTLLQDDHPDKIWEFLEFRHWEKRRPVWIEHRDEILDEWIEERPGSRPHGWWSYDAPRRKPEGAFYDKRLCEPRRQVGGTGTPQSDLLAIVPQYELGIPIGWIKAWHLDFFSLKVKAFDESDPPVFESQAAYLQRHGLLTEDEKKRLGPEDFEPETLSL